MRRKVVKKLLVINSNGCKLFIRLTESCTGTRIYTGSPSYPSEVYKKIPLRTAFILYINKHNLEEVK